MCENLRKSANYPLNQAIKKNSRRALYHITNKIAMPIVLQNARFGRFDNKAYFIDNYLILKRLGLQ